MKGTFCSESATGPAGDFYERIDDVTRAMELYIKGNATIVATERQCTMSLRTTRPRFNYWDNSEVSLEPFFSRASLDDAQTVDDEAIVGATKTTTTTN